MRDVAERLLDIQEAIARITKYTNLGREKFDQDEKFCNIRHSDVSTPTLAL